MRPGVEPHNLSGIRDSTRQPVPAAVAIGNFDGVHRGHLALVELAVTAARERSLAPLVLTFDPHPHEVLVGPDRAVLTSAGRKLELLRRVDPSLVVIVERFTSQLAALSPEEFADTILVQGLMARAVVVGVDFRFGHGRLGQLSRLRQLGQTLGFSVITGELVNDQAGPISSSRIRSAIERGNLREAEEQLSRPHALSGRVVHGDGRGRALGYPTANLSHVEELLPPNGVYACLVDRIDDSGHGRALGGGVLNIGVRPTLGAGFSLEVHVLDFAGDLYGTALRVHLLARLREERRFAGIEELVIQIERDVLAARTLHAERSPDPAAGGAWY
jgi:riboflavin kinase/FMN adenylyltransferase